MEIRKTNRNKGPKIVSFTSLKTWQEGHSLVLLVYQVTKKFPKSENFCLIDQMRRAVISITSNIAEGFGRQGYKERVRFLYLAQGSLTELKNQIIVAKDIGYLTEKDINQLVEQANITHRLLGGLIKKSKSFIK